MLGEYTIWAVYHLCLADKDTVVRSQRVQHSETIVDLRCKFMIGCSQAEHQLSEASEYYAYIIREVVPSQLYISFIGLVLILVSYCCSTKYMPIHLLILLIEGLIFIYLLVLKVLRQFILVVCYMLYPNSQLSDYKVVQHVFLNAIQDLPQNMFTLPSSYGILMPAECF